MTKNEIIKQFTTIKGIGEKKAELLYDNGFTSLVKLQNAKSSDLTKIKGITEKSAQDIIQEAQKIQTTPPEPKEEPTKETPSKTTKKPQKKEQEEPAAIQYKVKKKPKLDDTKKQHLKIRKDLKKRTPKFLREEWFRYKKISRNWRRPDGITSKMRRNLKYRPSKVRVGFRGPKDIRGLHPSGFEEITIHTITELDTLNPDTQAIRIGGTVGTKKRLEIAKRAKEKKIRILNMRD